MWRFLSPKIVYDVCFFFSMNIKWPLPPKCLKSQQKISTKLIRVIKTRIHLWRIRRVLWEIWETSIVLSFENKNSDSVLEDLRVQLPLKTARLLLLDLKGRLILLITTVFSFWFKVQVNYMEEECSSWQSAVSRLKECHWLKRCRMKCFHVSYKQFGGRERAVWTRGWASSFPFLLEIRLTEELFTRECQRRGHEVDTFSGMFWDAASTRLASVIWLLCTDARLHGDLSNKQ